MIRLTPVQGSILFFFVAPGTVAGVVPWLISQWTFQHPFLGSSVTRFVGAALIFAALDMVLDSFARFAVTGQGTPAPVSPTRRLVVTGYYRHIRNPMYVAVVTAITGQAIVFADGSLLVYAALVWLVFHAFVIFYEEPTLKRAFGDDYESYRAKVPRWLPRPTVFGREDRA